MGFAGAAVLAAGAAYMMNEKKEVASVAAAADSYPPHDLEASVKALPAWIQAGCGNEEYICPEKGAVWSSKEPLPFRLHDLNGHNNMCTDALKADLGIYDRLRTRKTSLGVNLGHCIKTGIDNKGHPMIKTCGLVAEMKSPGPSSPSFLTRSSRKDTVDTLPTPLTLPT